MIELFVKAVTISIEGKAPLLKMKRVLRTINRKLIIKKQCQQPYCVMM